MGRVIFLNIVGLLMKLFMSLHTIVAMLVSVVQHFTRVIGFSCSGLIIGKVDSLGDISFLELVPIVLAFFIWENKIRLRVDNRELVSIANIKEAPNLSE